MKHIHPITLVDASSAGPGADLVFRVLGALEGFKAANKFATSDFTTNFSTDLLYVFYSGSGSTN